MADKTNALAIVQRDVIAVVQDKVQSYVGSGQLVLPQNYSVENAMKAAWLAIQAAKDRNEKPAVEVCTKDSIANSILRMVVLGLTPAKTQCYFIVYGNQLTLQPSYFGDMHTAKQVDESIDYISAEVVYKGDEFKYSKVKGRTVIDKHTLDLSRVNKDAIIAAYCSIVRKDGSEDTTLMTMGEIEQAWRQSKMSPFDDAGKLKPGSTHYKFKADMCKKTVTHRACKLIINPSSDKNLLAEVYKDIEAENAELEAQEMIDVEANGTPFEVDEGTGEVTATASDELP